MDIERAEEPGISIINPSEADKAKANGAEVNAMDKQDTRPANPADLAKADEVDKRSTGTADLTNLVKANRVDKQSIGIVDLVKSDRAEADKANKPDIGSAMKDSWRRPVES